MKDYTLIVVIVFLVFTTNCQSNQDVNFEDSIQDFKSFILDEPIDSSFSDVYKEENFLMVLNPSGLYAKGYCGIFFEKSYKITAFNLRLAELEKNAIFNQKLKELDNFYVPNFKNEVTIEKFPIPSFDDSLLGLQDKVDENNSSILIFNKKQGQYFTQKGIKTAKEFIKNDIDEMGKGYSNGAVIDYTSKKIIYWTIVW